MQGKKLCFLDLETTGVNPEVDSILEVALILEQNKKTLQTVDQVIIPEKTPLTPFVTFLTGITQEEVSQKGLPFEKVKETLQEVLSESIIIGHNIAFDIAFLSAFGIDTSKTPYLDTHQLARIFLHEEESFALEVLAKKYGFLQPQAHRAMSDVLACREFFYFLVEDVLPKQKEIIATIYQELKDKSQWEGLQLLSFFAKSSPSSGLFSVADFSPPKYEENLPELFLKESSPSQKNDFPAKPFVFFQEPHFWERITSALSPKTTFLAILPDRTPYQTLKPPRNFLCPQAFFAFFKQQNHLDDTLSVFYAKCRQRMLQGIYDVHRYHLIGPEKYYWKFLHSHEAKSAFKRYQKSFEDKRVLAVKTQDFFPLFFSNSSAFSSRKWGLWDCFSFAEKLLFAAKKSLLLSDYAPEDDPRVAFFIHHLAKDFLEPKLKRSLHPDFTESIPLDPSEDLKDFSEMLASFLPQEAMELLQPFFEKGEAFFRWITISLARGEVGLHLWDPKAWEHLKHCTAPHITHIQSLFAPNHLSSFLEIFLGIQDFSLQSPPPKRLSFRCPEGLPSPKDNTFTERSVEVICEILAKNPGNTAINFSSQESLRNAFKAFAQRQDLQKNMLLLGEFISGSKGKIEALLQEGLAQGKKVLFLFQQSELPLVSHWEHLFLQKLPFKAPHPLLRYLESKYPNLQLWDHWTIPQLQSTLYQRLSPYLAAKHCWVLDKRVHQAWGKDLFQGMQWEVEGEI